MLGGPPPRTVAKQILGRHNYLALWLMGRVQWRSEATGRCFLGRGDYPYNCRARALRGLYRNETWVLRKGAFRLGTRIGAHDLLERGLK
jgi:hypothetical protein